MSLAVIVFLALLSIGVSNRTPVHPGAISLLVDGKSDSIQCRESSGPSTVLEADKPSRTRNFSLQGSYDCYRPIFSADERDPFVDRVLEAEIPHARSVAAAVQQSYDSNAPLAVKVEGDADEKILNAVAAIYRAELLTKLGPSRVSRFATDEHPALVIELHRVDVPQLMSRARLRFPNSKGAPLWRDI
jgi:hypothetical protein